MEIIYIYIYTFVTFLTLSVSFSLSRLQPMVKPSPWGSHQGNGWGSGGMSWGRDHRRGSGMGVPGSVSHVSPLKKPFSSNVIAPPKFPRSGGTLGPKSWIEENMFRTDSNSNSLLPLQVRGEEGLWLHWLVSLVLYDDLFGVCMWVGDRKVLFYGARVGKKEPVTEVGSIR